MIQKTLENGVQIYTNIIMRHALITILVLSLITITFLKAALTFEENMTRDIEVYLPDGEESTKILLEVRGKKYPANVCALPFYKKNYVKGVN